MVAKLLTADFVAIVFGFVVSDQSDQNHDFAEQHLRPVKMVNVSMRKMPKSSRHKTHHQHYELHLVSTVKAMSMLRCHLTSA